MIITMTVTVTSNTGEELAEKEKQISSGMDVLRYGLDWGNIGGGLATDALKEAASHIALLPRQPG